MLGVVRSAARQAKPALQGVRRMSSGNVDYALEAKEASKWKVVTFAAIPVIVGMAIYDFAGSHPHFEENPAYPYMRIRNKEFPWGDENLFVLKKEH